MSCTLNRTLSTLYSWYYVTVPAGGHGETSYEIWALAAHRQLVGDVTLGAEAEFSRS
jgi:hypothetical protein